MKWNAFSRHNRQLHSLHGTSIATEEIRSDAILEQIAFALFQQVGICFLRCAARRRYAERSQCFAAKIGNIVEKFRCVRIAFWCIATRIALITVTLIMFIIIVVARLWCRRIAKTVIERMLQFINKWSFSICIGRNWIGVGGHSSRRCWIFAIDIAAIRTKMNAVQKSLECD